MLTHDLVRHQVALFETIAIFAKANAVRLLPVFIEIIPDGCLVVCISQIQGQRLYIVIVGELHTQVYVGMQVCLSRGF